MRKGGKGGKEGREGKDGGEKGVNGVVIRVKLFATLRRYYPHLGIGEPMPVEVAEGTTVGQLLDHLCLPADEVKIVFVNNIVQGTGHVLHDGDDVGIFPPVGGG